MVLTTQSHFVIVFLEDNVLKFTKSFPVNDSNPLTRQDVLYTMAAFIYEGALKRLEPANNVPVVPVQITLIPPLNPEPFRALFNVLVSPTKIVQENGRVLCLDPVFTPKGCPKLGVTVKLTEQSHVRVMKGAVFGLDVVMIKSAWEHEEVARLYKEAQAYTRLKQLQGSRIPTFIGLFRSTECYFLITLLVSGQSPKSFDDLSELQR